MQTDAPALFTLRAVKEAAASAGSHYFDADTLRFFKARLSPCVRTLPDGSALVVESVRRWGDARRHYRVVRVSPTGQVERLTGIDGPAPCHWTSKGAHAYAARLAKNARAAPSA